MYSYVTKELPGVIAAGLAAQVDVSRVALTGHSMGGHGALTIALKNPGAYASVSAFSPICHPCDCPWGVKGARPLTPPTPRRCSLLVSYGR